MEKDNRLDERTGWGHVWISAEWKRQFLVLTPGVLRVFPCDQRSKIEKTLSLARCVVGLHKPFSLPKYPTKKRIWKNLLKLVASDQTFSQTDTAVITIKARRGKTCFVMFQSQVEAEVWKAGVEEAGALADASGAKKDSKKSSRRSKALQQASDAIDQTRVFLQTNSLLKPPFGLRWEAYPPLFKVRECSRPLQPPSPMLSQTKLEGGGMTASDRTEVVDTKPPKPLWCDLETLHGCTEFLRSSYLNFRALEQAALMVDHFKGSYQMGDSSLPDELRLEAWKGTARRIVKALVDQILANNLSMEPCITNDELMDQLWSASEVWVFGAVHDKIMGACKQMFAVQDASMDNVLAKLEKVDPAKLGVRAEFENLVLGEALNEFRRLNRLRTPYEKALCLRKTVKCIIDGIQSLINSCTGALKDTGGLLPCTDDLLSFMLLLMARAKVRNLHANGCYMENFINLHKDTNRGELVYHITNFVAACNYLQSSAVEELVSNIAFSQENAPSPMRHIQFSADDSSSSSPSLFKSTSGLTDLERSTQTYVTMTSSRNDSLESDANYRSRDSNRWEEVSERSCFDQDAFNHWTSSGSLNRGDFSEFDSIEEGPFDSRKAWWIERQESGGDDRFSGLPPLACRQRGGFALPGESPDFLLAPTYQ